MCGRIVRLYVWKQLHRLYHLIDHPAEPVAPLFNVAPMAWTPVIRHDKDDRREATLMQWWLVPFWAKTPKPEYAMFNARSEDADTKPAFRELFKRRRCVLPVNGFYEWTKGKGADKQAFHIQRRDEEVFGFAGLWDRWTDKETGEVIESCTILTATAGELLKPIHHRSPLVIGHADLDAWLNRGATDPTAVKPLMRTPDMVEFERRQVSSYVNNARNEGARCIEPV